MGGNRWIRSKASNGGKLEAARGAACVRGRVGSYNFPLGGLVTNDRAAAGPGAVFGGGVPAVAGALGGLTALGDLTTGTTTPPRSRSSTVHLCGGLAGRSARPLGPRSPGDCKATEVAAVVRRRGSRDEALDVSEGAAGVMSLAGAGPAPSIAASSTRL